MYSEREKCEKVRRNKTGNVKMDVAWEKTKTSLGLRHQCVKQAGHTAPASSGRYLPGKRLKVRLSSGGQRAPGPGYIWRWGWGMTFGEDTRGIGEFSSFVFVRLKPFRPSHTIAGLLDLGWGAAVLGEMDVARVSPYRVIRMIPPNAHIKRAWN